MLSDEEEELLIVRFKIAKESHPLTVVVLYVYVPLSK